jgi:hypothetical protein
MALAVFPGWKQAGLTFALFTVLEVTTANIIEPWLYGAHTGISPLAILVAAIFWATLWGPVGLILSTPLTLCLILVGRYVPQMNFLEVLLGDAPALTPQELFYQRLLAMDPVEACNVAESYLESHTLENLYEEVFIPALRLAEEDRHSDIIGDRSADFISQSTRELIDDLGDRSQRRQSGDEQQKQGEDAPAVPQFPEAGIVCVPARDEADELVGMMLTQLLQKAGSKNCRYLSIGTVENMLDQLERGGFTIVCVSALPPFAVGQARSLCKRLRARLPHISIVVGLWGFAGGVTKAQERMAPASPDGVCTSLSDAMMQLRRLAEQRAVSTADAGPQVTAA